MLRAEIKLFADDNFPPDWIANTEERHHGWVIGGGLEYMVHPNVILGVDYSYIDLGSERHTAPYWCRPQAPIPVWILMQTLTREFRLSPHGSVSN